MLKSVSPLRTVCFFSLPILPLGEVEIMGLYEVSAGIVADAVVTGSGVTCCGTVGTMPVLSNVPPLYAGGVAVASGRTSVTSPRMPALACVVGGGVVQPTPHANAQAEKPAVASV